MSYTFFCRSSSPFSNWNQNGEKFELYGQYFNCAEQAMMWCKAWLFGDMDKAKEILESEYRKNSKPWGVKWKALMKRCGKLCVCRLFTWY